MSVSLPLCLSIIILILQSSGVGGNGCGAEGSCTLGVVCWLLGGSLQRSRSACSTGHLFLDWFLTCCLHPRPPPPPVSRIQVPPPADRYPIRGGCGIGGGGLQRRIIGGREAGWAELPWTALLRLGPFQCGGVLLSPRFVATAAHCVYRARLSDITVYLGEHDTEDTGRVSEPLPEESYRVVDKIVHPLFRFRLSQPDRFDLALVRLARPVLFRENILPICLPKGDNALSGKTALVAGWGKTDTSYGKTGTNILRKAEVPILSDRECLQWHRHKKIRLELHREMFCAGHSDGRIDACLGDSGGPLIVEEDGRWTLAGITSAGFGCAVDHQPGIYHKIHVTKDWIIANIRS